MRAKAFLLSLLVAATAVVSAQMPPGFKMPSLRYNPALLMNPDVQKDMHVSPTVASKVQGVLMTQGMKLMPLLMGGATGKKSNPGDSEKLMKTLLGAYEAMQNDTLKLLTPPQRTRLHEITLQQTGASALLDPKEAAEVGLTTSQSKALQAALTKSAMKQRSSTGNMMNGGMNSNNMAEIATKAAAAVKQAHKESDAALNAILTPAQKTKWKKLQGRHIELKGAAGMGGMMGM